MGKTNEIHRIKVNNINPQDILVDNIAIKDILESYTISRTKK